MIDILFVIQEMHESIKIINQCINMMPEGAIKIDNNKIFSVSKNSNETSNGEFNSIILNIYTEGFHIPAGLVLFCLQKHQKRETGVFLIC